MSSAYKVIFSGRARDQLEAIYDHIAAAAAPAVALRFTDAIAGHIEGLASFPRRGTARDDLSPGLCTISFRGRVTIAFAIDDDHVLVLGVFYAGRDFEALLREE